MGATMKAKTHKLPQARQDELFIEQLGEDLLVYDARHFRAHRLNRTAAWMWRHCDGQRTVADAARLLSDELRQPVGEDLVWLSLESLDRAQLLSVPLQRPSGASAESRRAMMQKLAVAGGLMLLLPAITPLTRPAEADEVGTPTAVKIPKGPAISGTVTGNGDALFGSANTGVGVQGNSEKAAGVAGYCNGDAPGVRGTSLLGNGVHGIAAEAGGGSSHFGVKGECGSGGGGVQGISKRGYGVSAHSATGIALFAESQSGGKAGVFKGDVEVSGDIRLLNADCAEDFDIIDAESIDPGTVMVLSPAGGLQLSHRAYDKRVAGVISGAGDYQPGLILDKRPTGNPRKPVALMGKVFCKVDAKYGPIEIGDLLTTSDTPGHAMKASDSGKAFGSVLGKALQPWTKGEGLIPILVTLQ